ncbi:MAG: Na+/H+ antiporter NhaA [Bowdeniella nasicola]|nr:Na+/H+ antiporter NhaA [Bowdeniella nasicola]
MPEQVKAPNEIQRRVPDRGPDSSARPARHHYVRRGNGIVRSSRYNAPGSRTVRRPRKFDIRRRRLYTYQYSLKAGPDGFKQFLQSIPARLHHAPTAGMVLLAGAVVALIWANSPAKASYHAISEYAIGPQSLHLHLPLSHWAADGLLAVFFFVVGLELKTEFVTGALRDIKQALVPVLAAVFGMIGPALVYVTVQVITESDGLHGWAIPVATDIAFAVALLGIFGSGLPPAVRTFLLTLAVVDDLLGIIIIAIFYTAELNFVALAGALVLVAVFGLLVSRRKIWVPVLVLLAVGSWVLMHMSGVHATIAGVLLGLVVPAKLGSAEHTSMTIQWTEIFHPWSAGLVLPVFAFFAAGVTVTDAGPMSEILFDPVAFGIMLALPLGKLLGIWGGTAMLVKTTRLRLSGGVDLVDLVGVSLLGGIGFTVSLLIAGLSFGDSPETDHAKIGVILGSLIAAMLGAYALRRRTQTAIRG